MSHLDLFHYYHQDNQAKKTIFLLHGTGGDERDLLPLVTDFSDSFNFVGIRGNVSEHGMPRFFKRLGMGVFDQESIREESEKLSKFLSAWYESIPMTANDAYYLGYSNGANMILSMVFLYPELIQQAMLLHPMLPFESEFVNLENHRFLVTLGERDQMIPLEESKKVVRTLSDFNATVTEVTHEGGHEIRAVEIEAIAGFIRD